MIHAPPPARPPSEGWLTLEEARTLLGVSASTLRRWADTGRLPTQRTTGGHRRFAAEAIRALAPLSPPAARPADARPLDQESWYRHLHASPAAGQMRELGQRLLGLLIQYLVWSGEDARFLADGRAVGTQYGALVRAAGGTLRDTIAACLHFRRAFWRMALQIPTIAQTTDAQEVVRIAERIEEFMDAVLLSTVAGYEQAPANGAEST